MTCVQVPTAWVKVPKMTLKAISTKMETRLTSGGRLSSPSFKNNKWSHPYCLANRKWFHWMNRKWHHWLSRKLHHLNQKWSFSRVAITPLPWCCSMPSCLILSVHCRINFLTWNRRLQHSFPVIIACLKGSWCPWLAHAVCWIPWLDYNLFRVMMLIRVFWISVWFMFRIKWLSPWLAYRFTHLAIMNIGKFLLFIRTYGKDSGYGVLIA